MSFAEDCRVFRWRGDWWVSATRRDLHPAGLCQMILARLNGDRLDRYQLLDAGHDGRHEKNWMPFVQDDQLYFVYSCHPFVVVRWDPAARQITEVARHAVPPAPADLRGGSQGVPLADGYLFIVHQARHGAAGRSYTHRLLRMNDQFEPVGLSAPFSFVPDGIEFCAGAAVADGKLLMSFGLNDRVAALAIAPLEAILPVISPLTRPAPVPVPGARAG